MGRYAGVHQDCCFLVAKTLDKSAAPRDERGGQLIRSEGICASVRDAAADSPDHATFDFMNAEQISGVRLAESNIAPRRGILIYGFDDSRRPLSAMMHSKCWRVRVFASGCASRHHSARWCIRFITAVLFMRAKLRAKSQMHSDLLGFTDPEPGVSETPSLAERAKSYLIDTIIRGIPMPDACHFFFLRSRTKPDTLEPQREVVDGQERLRTVLAFIEPGLVDNFDSSSTV
jgi:hypothetical protein